MDQVKRQCTVVLHDDRVSQGHILCGSNILPLGFLAYLSAAGATRLCIVAKAAASHPDEISIHTSLAQRFGFENRANAVVELIEDYGVATATHVELFFREQHLTRADMWRMMRDLHKTVMYSGQSVDYLGSPTAQIEAIFISGRKVDCAYVDECKTKPIFRSGSARYTFLIQISKEMLEHWVNGDLMYERVLLGFLPDLFHRWEKLKVRHQVSVVLFGRSYVPGVAGNGGTHASNALPSQPADFFHVVASDVSSSVWPDLVRKLKRVFHGTQLHRQVSLAAKGNMLEAIQLAAMAFADETSDPHLSSTGTSIIAITAGAGLFESEHEMLKNTTQLLMGNSIGVDIVAVSPKPLHPVPLFSYTRDDSCEYALPHWVDISFWQGSDALAVPMYLLPETSDYVHQVSVPAFQSSQTKKDEASMSVAMAMDAYDEDLFSSMQPSSPAKHTVNLGPVVLSTALSDTPKQAQRALPAAMPKSECMDAPPANLPAGHEDALTAPKTPTKRPKIGGLPPHALMASGRKISLGPKGLALSRGTASITLSAEYAEQGRDGPPHSLFKPNEASSGLTRQLRASLARKSSQQSLASHSTSDTAETSRPIDIHNGHCGASDAEDQASLIEQKVLATVTEQELAADASLPQPSNAKRDPFYAAMRAAEEEGHWTMSPWVVLLNPCNPKRDNMRVAAQYRKWQHVFPRAISSTTFKWRSMCSPAALPLTTEYRPSLRELESYQTKKVRRLLVSMTNTAGRGGAQHVLEQLIQLRLTHGFQIVPQVQESGSLTTPERLLMSLGNTHHELLCLSDAEIQVVEYDQVSPAKDEILDQPEKTCFRLRTAAATKAVVAETSHVALRSPPDWSEMDDQLVGNDRALIDQDGFRLRFVLIPVELVRTGQGAAAASRELSDEERRLEGIQRLTQSWQRARYIRAEDQRHQASLVRTKSTAAFDRDPNPLAIEYQTGDPSAVVNAYGPTLTGGLHSGELVAPLFAESELYHSSTFDVARLVKQMQEEPPHGVEVRDRRWFARLHFKCFRGDETVNWLLRVFKDLHTREDAVAIGNELMKRGVFSHVRHRHDFRDGNYFYQITSAHRTTDYPDTATVFAKGLRSVPSTPTAESRSSPMMRSVHADSASLGKLTPIMLPVDKKQVLLSHMLMCDVDPAKKSDQLEIVNLHYDRIHNPENCYHIQLGWTNTTSKLIRETVNRWAALTEKHGLKLVQLPLLEACKAPTQHPFEHPVYVKLALKPPEKIIKTPMIDPHMFSPPLLEDPLAYQKALLRKMGFVLDFEAAASFTTKLDVVYSYGRPTYELTQFVHRSGLLLAQICTERNGFLLLPNSLASQRPSASGKHAEAQCVEDIVRTFTLFCHDEKALKALYEEANKPRLPPPSPFMSEASMDGDVPPTQLPPHLLHRVVMRGLN